MVVFFVNLVQANPFDNFENDILTKNILALGSYDYLVIDSLNFLKEALEVYKNQPILIFTNFPPDYFYRKQGTNINNFRLEPFQHWPVELYKFSASLFRDVCLNNKIMGIHFITSALRQVVSDNHFRIITDGTNTSCSVIRRRKWMHNPDIEYNVFLKKFMLNKISKAIESSFLTFPCHKQLVVNPVIQFGQN